MSPFKQIGFLAVTATLALAMPAHAQLTVVQLQYQINTEIVPGVQGGITAPTLNQILNGIVLSYPPLTSANMAGGAALVNGAIVAGNCLSWGPGVTDSGTPCGGGGSVTFASAADVQAGTSSTKVVSPAALSGSASPQTLTFVGGGTTAWNAALGYNALLTLTASTTTIGNPSNLIIGLTYSLQLIQGGAGSFTVSWGTDYDWGAAGVPVLSTAPGAIDLVTMLAVSPSKLLCTFNGGF